MCPQWRINAPESSQYPLGTKQVIKDDQHDEQCDTMDSDAATTTRPLHPLHTGPGPDGDEHTPLKGCASTSGDHQEVPSAFWTVPATQPPQSLTAKCLLLTTTTSQFSHTQDTPKKLPKTKSPTVAPTSLLRGAIDPP